MLIKLLRAGVNLTQRTLQEGTKISSAALSEVLSKLECEGLIRRTRSEQDKRQLDISLTPEGKQAAMGVASKKIGFERCAFSPLSDEERLQLADMLERLARHWKEIEEREREANARE